MFYYFGKITFFDIVILLISGSFCLFLTTYFFYYLHSLIEIKPEEEKAYSKLIKLFNPVNKENKASNLIRVFILLKKLYNDNDILLREYVLKKNHKNKKKKWKNRKKTELQNKRFSVITINLFNKNKQIKEVDNNNDEKHKEKQKFIKFLENKYIIKMKFINEIKILVIN